VCEQEANNNSLDHGQNTTLMGLQLVSLMKALDELAFLWSAFPLQGPAVIACDNKSALPPCRDHKEGQHVKHVDNVRHVARDHVAS
jgi:hypothetical protein